MSNLILTDDQANAVTALKDFTRNSKLQFVLSGPAGSGKSFTLTNFIKNWCSDRTVCMTGTTNKACRVIQNFASTHKLKVEVSTIHSLLGLVVKQREDKTLLVQDGKNTIMDYNLVVIDESSMINEELFNYIITASKNHRIKVIFVGDKHQLPPVHEDSSLVFSPKTTMDSYTLKKIVRQAKGNPIIKLASAIRKAMYDDTVVNILDYAETYDKAGVTIRKGKKFTDLFYSAFGTKRYVRNADSFRVISWTNNKVRYYNNKIRPIFFGYDPKDDFVVGERLVTCAPVQKVVEYQNDKAQTKIIMPTDTEGVVRSVSRTVHPDFRGSNYEVWAVEFSPYGEESLVNVYVPTKEGMHAVNNDLNRLATSAKTASNGRERSIMWSKFWTIKNLMSDLRPSHSYTAHRSQGSSYQIAFVDACDIGRNRNRLEALQCLYVAVTRASQLVIINTDTF